MLRKWIISIFLLFVVSGYGQDGLFKKNNNNEALHVRRIVELWRSGENDLVISQIKQFSKEQPYSAFSDSLTVFLGDVYLKKGDYENALEEYEKISRHELRDKVMVNKLHCLYFLGHFNELLQRTTIFWEKRGQENLLEEDPGIFFYHIEAKLRNITSQNIKLEDKQIQSRKLITYYEQLIDTPYRDQSIISLAEIYRLCGEDLKAAELYLRVAKEHPDIGETLLYQAGVSLAARYPEASLELFSRVMEQGGDQAPEAALKWSVMLFETERFDELLLAEEKLKTVFPKDQSSLLQSMFGMACLGKGEYQNAVVYLIPFLTDEEVPEAHKKAGMLNLAIAAHKLENIELLNDVIVAFNETFRGDADIAKVFFLRALTYQDQGENSLAFVDLDWIVGNFPLFEDRIEALYQHGVVLYKIKKFEESRNELASFIKRYPHNEHITSAYKHFLNSSLGLFEIVQEEKLPFYRQQLIGDLELVLGISGALDEDQRYKCQLQLATLFHEEKRFEDSLELLRSHLKECPKDENLYRVHLLMALGYQEMENMPSFAFHAEQTLSLNPDVPEASNLHVSLFNFYLRSSREIDEDSESSEEQKERYLRLSANHLYNSLKKGNEEIDAKPLLWLGDHYFGEVENNRNRSKDNVLDDEGVRELAENGVKVFEEILNLSPEDDIVEILEDELPLESSVVKFTHLLGYLGETERQISFLDCLYQHYSEHPEWSWQHKDETLLLLGEAYEFIGECDRALTIYREVIENSKFGKGYFYDGAQLQLARLEFKLLNDVENSLKRMHKLRVLKHLTQEPIHLEAAIEGAEMTASLQTSEERTEGLLYLFRDIREDFTNEKGIDAKDYHEMRRRLPVQDKVYQAYIMLLDARIALLEAEIADVEGNFDDSFSYREAAETVFGALLEENFAVSKYIVNEAKRGLQGVGTNFIE